MRNLPAATALALLLLIPGAHALTYHDTSPAGPLFPEWDGGSTEIEFADINLDGHVDFLSIGDHGSPYINTDQHGVMVYFGDGAGGWSIHMEGNFGYGGIAVGDVDNDGLLDVGYGMHHDYASGDLGDQLIEVALGDGTGTAWIPWDDGLASNGENYGMFATDFADFDLDGDLDLVSGSFGCCNGIHVYLNNGDGTWTQSFALTGGNAQHQLATGDVNGDGYPDIAASYQHGTVFLGDGAGGFTIADAGLPAAGTSGVAGVALGDVDHDGCADLAFVQSGAVHVYVWRADHWEPRIDGLPPAAGFNIAQLWDLDLDGHVDVAASGDGACAIALGDGSGGWTAGGGFTAPEAVGTQAFRAGGDVDHNGYPDFVFLQEEGDWITYQNYLYVYAEDTLPTERFVVMQYPRGCETLVLGTVATLCWSAAHLGDAPSRVTIELSPSGPTGPWQPIAQGIPDSGHHQWLVAGPITSEAHVRVTLDQDGQSVAGISGPFRLISLDPAAVLQDFVPERASFRILPNPIIAGAWVQVEGEILEILTPTGRILNRLALRNGAVYWPRTDCRGARLPAGQYILRAGDRTRRAVLMP